MELDGARTNCATRSVQVLERVVRAPWSATTVLSWTAKPVSVSVLRDGMARTVQSFVRIDTRFAAGLTAGPKAGVKANMEKDIQAQCPAVCGVCEADPEAEEGLCPPVRGPAADSAQTMFIKSHQSTMIFVMIVITFTISSCDAL